MKEQDLLKALGEIREEYILEAAPAEERADREAADPAEFMQTKVREEKKVIPWRRYGRIIGTAAAGLVLIAGVGVYQKITRNGSAEQAQLTVEYSADEGVSAENYASEKQVFGIKTDAEDEDAGALAEEYVEEEIALAESADLAEGEELPLENANMVNPWISCVSLEEGEKTAGFALTVPEADTVFSKQEIYAVADTLIEVRYVDADGEEGYRIRKGIGTESVDGDYNQYDTEYTVEIDEREVTLKGNGTEIAVARWTEEEYSYVIMAGATGFSEEEMTRLIQEIR